LKLGRWERGERRWIEEWRRKEVEIGKKFDLI